MSKSNQNLMPKKQLRQEQLKHLRNKCLYRADGKPDIYSFGEFKDGLTSDEVKDYLRIRTNSMDIKKILRKYEKVSGANTCSLTVVNGQQVTLHYRCDVSRHAEAAIENTPTYFD